MLADGNGKQLVFEPEVARRGNRHHMKNEGENEGENPVKGKHI